MLLWQNCCPSCIAHTVSALPLPKWPSCEWQWRFEDTASLWAAPRLNIVVERENPDSGDGPSAESGNRTLGTRRRRWSDHRSWSYAITGSVECLPLDAAIVGLPQTAIHLTKGAVLHIALKGQAQGGTFYHSTPSDNEGTLPSIRRPSMLPLPPSLLARRPASD